MSDGPQQPPKTGAEPTSDVDAIIAQRAVDVPPVTGAADAHRHPAPRAREDSRLGIRHQHGEKTAVGHATGLVS
jgi:hypothetical protein